MPRVYTRISPEVRFWSHIEKTDTCWNWKALLFWDGYGSFFIQDGDSHVRAHRFSWELHFGQIPPGLLVCHKCDNRRCVRPDHLFLGSHRDNNHDRNTKGRHPDHRGELNPSSKFKQEDIISIRNLSANGIKTSVIAKQFNISHAYAWMIINRKKWTHLP